MQAIIPRSAIRIETATLDDLPAIDALQKQFGKALGYFPTAQLKGYLETGGVLVARGDRRHEGTEAHRHEGEEGAEEGIASSCMPSVPPCLGASVPDLAGYIISRDRYLKRDELGVIYQLCVSPSAHRKLIGAALVKAAFERSAYGCRLFCLWCAQDLEANRFWEAMGFVPIAFRAGSGKRRRVHIFWERRVRADDVVTPYWFPARTTGGALRDDRLVFPIPHGLAWHDPMPVILPQQDEQEQPNPEQRALPEKPAGRPKAKAKIIAPAPTVSRYAISRSTLYFAPRPEEKPIQKPRPKRPAVKSNPRLLAMARELRDRWIELVNAGELVLADARYDVARIECRSPTPQRLLPAA
jgi:ribosomal protein S18 acetylase RimI-like enzyme